MWGFWTAQSQAEGWKQWVKRSPLSIVAGRERKEETPLLVLIILILFHCNNNKSKQGLAQ